MSNSKNPSGMGAISTVIQMLNAGDNFSVVMMSIAEHSGYLKRYSRGIISFFIKGGLEASRSFLERLEMFSLAESLGGVESLIEHPAIMTHVSLPKEVKEKLGISDELIRISAGIENVDDLIDDLEKPKTKTVLV